MIREKFISGLIGALFVAVFQPFGLSDLGSRRLPLLLGISLVIVFSCIVCEYAVRLLFRMPHDSRRGPVYNNRRGMAFQLCNIVLMPVLMALFLHFFACNEQVDNHLSWSNYLWTLMVCLCSSFIIGLYWRNVYWKRFYQQQLEEAQLLSGMLMERARTAEQEEQETLVRLDSATRESLSLLPSRFLFAESAGNYVYVHHLLPDGTCSHATLRMSIKSVVAALAGCAHVMQCHRAYVVNLGHVQKVESRSSGIGLLMNHCRMVVPVSKAYVGEVKERIKNPARSSQ